MVRIPWYIVIVILPAALPGDFQWQARQCFTKPNSLGLSGHAIPRKRLRRLRSFKRAEKEPSRFPSRRGQGSMKGHLVLRPSNAVFLHTWSCNVAAWCWPTGMKNRNMRLIPKKPGLADENIFFLSQFIHYLMLFGESTRDNILLRSQYVYIFFMLFHSSGTPDT